MSKTNGHYYGSPYADHYLLHDPETLPRYGALARKVILYYVGDRYNPHTDALTHEPFIRHMIKEFVSYKVFHRLPGYDWEWLDQSFRKYFSGCFGLNLPYDPMRIKAGYKGITKAQKQPESTSIH